MNVQELFKKADSVEVADAYFIMHDIFYLYEKHTLEEKIRATEKLKKIIEEHVMRFASCKPVPIERQKTVFVFELPDYDYEACGEVNYSISVIYDDVANEKITKNFTVWNDEGETRIEQYGIDMVKLEEIASYNIAEVCMEELGIAACCGERLYEFFRFGFADKTCEEDIGKFIHFLNEAINDVEEGRTCSSEELLEEWHKKFLESCTDPDEKQHGILTREYQKSVKEIERRHRYKILEENHQKVVTLIREEYKRRIRYEQKNKL